MSLRTAINLKCRDCIYDPKSGLGTWREQAAQCTVTSCPLYAVRPLPLSGPLARNGHSNSPDSISVEAA